MRAIKRNRDSSFGSIPIYAIYIYIYNIKAAKTTTAMIMMMIDLTSIILETPTDRMYSYLFSVLDSMDHN